MSGFVVLLSDGTYFRTEKPEIYSSKLVYCLTPFMAHPRPAKKGVKG